MHESGRQRVNLDINNAPRYYQTVMIKGFKDRETEKVYNRQFSRKLPPDIQPTARRKLEVLNAAGSLRDLTIPPSNRLERLSGNRRGQHSIRINAQWRNCFVWRDRDANEVEIVDYH